MTKYMSGFTLVGYNFGMARVFIVQMKDQPTTARIEAEKVEERGRQDTDGRLVFIDDKRAACGRLQRMDGARLVEAILGPRLRQTDGSPGTYLKQARRIE